MFHSTIPPDLPALPQYQLRPLPPLIPGLPDAYLAVISPVVAYWLVSVLFHLIDVYDIFPQYRLHTPAEILRRNRVSRYEVLRDVLIQQVIQTAVGIGFSWLDPQATIGKESYDVHVWARRIRIAERAVPMLLGLFGVNGPALADRVMKQQPYLAGVLRGGHYPGLLATVDYDGYMMSAPAFAPWEMHVASAIYYWIVPALQFAAAICILDTWQYFWHRAMHLNRWLYTTFHSRHHRLYVPYAYGALYNHPVEGFLLDTLGACVSYMAVGMTTRQTLIFFTIGSVKTVDDHCGYALPWDPLQMVTGNNAAYHDIHHQSWGIKTNFSQPFSTVWDRIMGTMWVGGDVSARYARTRMAAEDQTRKEMGPPTGDAQSSDRDGESGKEPDPIAVVNAGVPHAAPNGTASAQAAESRKQVLDDKTNGGPAVIRDEIAEEQREAGLLRRSPRKKSTSSTAEESWKGLKMMSGGMHSGVGAVLKGAKS